MSTILFIHAHPDDESLWSGVAIAQHALAGDEVIVLTCTLGEEGEVIPAATRRFELRPNQPRSDRMFEELPALRAAELIAACATLGARPVLLADLAGRALRDSGMAGSAAAAHPNAFVAADVEQLAAVVAQFIDAEGVSQVVSYERGGGYGHPDHIQAHRLACAAVRRSRRHPRLAAIVVPLAWAQQDRVQLAELVMPAPGVAVPAFDDPHPAAVVDLEPVGVYDDPRAADRQTEALRYHRTQVDVRDGWYMLSNGIAALLSGREALVELDPDDGSIREED